MAKKKIVKYYKDMYLGNLTEEQADTLIAISNSKCIDSLKNCIYHLSNEVITRVIAYATNYEAQPVLDTEDIDIGEARDYQTVGIAFMYTALSAMLGDSVGLGKTIQIAGTVNLCTIEKEKTGKEPFRFLFLTDKNSIGQISDKLIRHTAQYVHAMSGEQKYVEPFIESMENNGVWCSVVGSHSLITNTKFFKWLNLNIDKFDMLIVDESFVLKNSSTDMFKNIQIIRPYFKRFIELNATPYETKIDDFYNQLRLVDDTMLPTRVEFDKEYCKKDYRGYIPRVVGYKNEDLFRQRISLRYLARTRKELGAKFENNNAVLMISSLSSEQKDLMKKTSLWRMVCECPTALDSDIVFDYESVPKLMDLMTILANKVAEEDTVMLYCYYKEAQRELKGFLEAEGYECEIINGETTTKAKENIIHDFNNKLFKILITNIQRSIDLTSCNNLILYSYDYNPQKLVQVEGRVTREFDIINKNIYLLCSKGRELKYLQTVIQKRANESSKIANRDLSCVLDILASSILNKEHSKK